MNKISIEDIPISTIEDIKCIFSHLFKSDEILLFAYILYYRQEYENYHDHNKVQELFKQLADNIKEIQKSHKYYEDKRAKENDTNGN